VKALALITLSKVVGEQAKPLTYMPTLAVPAQQGVAEAQNRRVEITWR